MSTIKNYLSLVKFSHTVFAMPFALLGFFIGIGMLQQDGNNIIGTWQFYKMLLLVLGCMITARSAAMTFNRYLDRTFDEKNPRTAIREIPAGIIKANSALLFTIVCCILFMVCCWFINRLCFYLSPVALFVVLFYSYTKRFTALCHIVLGLGLGLAPIGAYLAVTGSFHILPIVLSFAVLFWVSGFDIIYALQDEQFDKDNGLHSIPAALGRRGALTVSVILHLLSAGCIITCGLLFNAGWLYWGGVGVFCLLLIRQHLIVSPKDLSRVNLAFFTLNGIASVLFAALAIADGFVR